MEEEANDAINRVLEILQNRVDQFGVSEPTIQKQGQHRILVELAGIQDSERARSLLQSTALLEFYLVKNAAVTNEILIQLDDLLKESTTEEELVELTKSLQKEKSKVETETVDDEDDDESITVDEIFGDTETIQDDSGTSTGSEIFADAPFRSLIEPLPGDMGVSEKNVYALKKLLARNEVQSMLKSSMGQFLFSHEAKPVPGSPSQEKIYRLYYLERTPELTGGVVDLSLIHI